MDVIQPKPQGVFPGGPALGELYLSQRRGGIGERQIDRFVDLVGIVIVDIEGHDVGYDACLTVDRAHLGIGDVHLQAELRIAEAQHLAKVFLVPGDRLDVSRILCA